MVGAGAQEGVQLLLQVPHPPPPLVAPRSGPVDAVQCYSCLAFQSVWWAWPVCTKHDGRCPTCLRTILLSQFCRGIQRLLMLPEAGRQGVVQREEVAHNDFDLAEPVLLWRGLLGPAALMLMRLLSQMPWRPHIV